MNFLFVNHYANAPVGGNNPYRTCFMAEELVKLGHQVTIVAAAHSHLRLEQPKVGQTLHEEAHNGVNYLFLPNAPITGSTLSRLRNMFGFLWSMWRYRKRIQQIAKPDVVVEATTYILPIFISRSIARANQALLIYEVRDLWPLSPAQISGSSRWHPVFLAIGTAQRTAIRSADCVMSTLRYANEYFEQYIHRPRAFAHIQNGISRAFLDTLPETSGDTLDAIHRIKSTHAGVIGYTGGMGPANALNPLLDAAIPLAQDNVAVVLVGQGPRLAELKALADQPGHETLFVFDAVPKQEIMPITRMFDLGFVGGVNAPFHAYGSSQNKLFDYMYCAVPALFCINTRDDLVQSAECGIVMPEPTGKTIATQARQFFALPEEKRRQLGQNGLTTVLSHYEYAGITRTFLDVIERLPRSNST